MIWRIREITNQPRQVDLHCRKMRSTISFRPLFLSGDLPILRNLYQAYRTKGGREVLLKQTQEYGDRIWGLGCYGRWMWSRMPIFFRYAAATAKSFQSCPTLCNPIDSSPPGSSIPGILQARTLEWVAISFSNAWKWKVKVKGLSRVRLFVNSMDCSLPGFFIHGILQARVLEWGAIAFSIFRYEIHIKECSQYQTPAVFSRHLLYRVKG